jgi:hypothetical protein
VYRAPLDRILSEIDSAVTALRNAAYQIGQVPADGEEVVAEALAQLASSSANLASVRERIEPMAEATRRRAALDRAWMLVRLYQAGMLDRELAMELTQHTPTMHQERYGYPEDLRAALGDPDLVRAILRITVFNSCICGTFHY